MVICIGSIGVFFGCIGYLLFFKEWCKEIINLIYGLEIINVDDDESEVKVLREKCCCFKCGMVMENYLIDEKCKLYICGNSFDCEGYEIEFGNFKIKGYDGFIVECDKCGLDM